jgi:hypothetical protein
MLSLVAISCLKGSEMSEFGSQHAVGRHTSSEPTTAMAACKSRVAILVYTVFAMNIMAVVAPAAIVAKPVHAYVKHMHVYDERMMGSGVQLRQPDYIAVPRAAELQEHVYDPFADMPQE